MGETNNFPGLKNETETETFNFGLMEPRPRPRLSFWVSWNRDRDRDFNMKSRETETFTRPDILSLGGTETGTETTKVSVPRVSAPRPPISGEAAYSQCTIEKYSRLSKSAAVQSMSLLPLIDLNFCKMIMWFLS